MSSLTRSSWLRRSAAMVVAVLGLGAMTTLAAKPADARVFVRVGIGAPVWGWGYYHPGYWHRPYYRPYYPAYYRNWQWRHWCAFHPYRCYR
ncbi:MAG: hypothetical protein ACREE1_16580 [Stellaceae bacterium]